MFCSGPAMSFPERAWTSARNRKSPLNLNPLIESALAAGFSSGLEATTLLCPGGELLPLEAAWESEGSKLAGATVTPGAVWGFDGLADVAATVDSDTFESAAGRVVSPPYCFLRAWMMDSCSVNFNFSSSIAFFWS